MSKSKGNNVPVLRRNALWLAIALCPVGLATVTSAWAQAAQVQTHRFAMPAQPLGAALNQLAET